MNQPSTTELQSTITDLRAKLALYEGLTEFSHKEIYNFPTPRTDEVKPHNPEAMTGHTLDLLIHSTKLEQEVQFLSNRLIVRTTNYEQQNTQLRKELAEAKRALLTEKSS